MVLGVAIVLYFIVEKDIDRYANIFLWKEIKREILTLGTHYKTYALQTKGLTKFLADVKKEGETALG